jgi:glycosyltransferase involved in cell wall biosynthesis
VSRALRSAHPDVVVTTGFNPPQLTAILYSVLHGIPHVAQTDGTVRSEATLTPLHRVVRRWTARRTRAFVAASPEGMDLQRSWGAEPAALHRSPLAIDNDRFSSERAPRDVDLLFSGQLAEVKNPFFAIDVAVAVADRLGRRVSLAMLGDGPLRPALAQRAAEVADRVEVDLVGFQRQSELPRWYARSRVFLFPTRWDPWGLVANEAAAAGTPQVISPHAGAAGYLVVDGAAGFVVPLEVDRWTDRVAELLTDDHRWADMSAASREAVAPLTFRAAAEGLRAGILQAAGVRPPGA